MTSHFRVYGSKGSLDCDLAFNYEGPRLRGSLSGTNFDEQSQLRHPYQFQAEADHFSNCVLHNLEPQCPGEEGLRDMRYITEIYRTAGINL
jgi:predicted dehydrogenase